MIDSLLLMNFLYLEMRSGGKICGIGGGAEGLAGRRGGSLLLDMVVFKCLFDQLVGLLFLFSGVAVWFGAVSAGMIICIYSRSG